MKRTAIFLALIPLLISPNISRAQEDFETANPDENRLKIGGELLTDERILLKNGNDWAWNENRIAVKLDKRIRDNSKFYGEVWLRNMGLPTAARSADLFNKGIVDPIDFEIREAYVQMFDLLTKNLDVKIGRQRIAWGTADKINPTDNLNPFDMEDILDFGRHRASDAIDINYYLSADFSFQGVFVPFFQPANLPVGIFANALNPPMDLPQGMVLKGLSDSLLMPRYNLKESSTLGVKFRGSAIGVDFSLSYVWGRDGLPINTSTTVVPVDALGGISISSQLSFMQAHIIGADLSTSIAGIGFWAEAAAFLPANDVVTTYDFSALYPGSPIPLVSHTTLLEKNKPYVKYIIGADYLFKDNSYLNIQYLHGFMHEKGNDNLNDYFFMQYDKKFFNEKLSIAPIGGAFIVTDWDNIRENYALVYMPQVAYKATDDVEITLSTAFFNGKGDNLFANLKDFNMLMLKMKYNF